MQVHLYSQQIIQKNQIMSDSQLNLSVFTINLQSIKINIKFPCNMIIEFDGRSLTEQVGSLDKNKFIFNQQITLKEQIGKKFFQLLVYLVSGKGKYVAGVLKLSHEQMIRMEGQPIALPLTKCLDKNSFCELRVEQIQTEKLALPLEKADFLSVQPKRKIKSSHQIDIIGGSKTARQQKKENDESYRGTVKNRSKRLERSISPNFDKLNLEKNLQSEVMASNYQQLKRKYRQQLENIKAETSKRMALENNENNYKLQILKLKKKIEELEQNVSSKQMKLKELTNQVDLLKQKQFSLEYLLEEKNNLQQKIEVYEEMINSLNEEQTQLKRLHQKNFDEQLRKVSIIKKQMAELKKEFHEKQELMNQKLNQALEQLSQKESQLSNIYIELNQKQKIIYSVKLSLEQAKNQYEKKMIQIGDQNREEKENLKIKLQENERKNKNLIFQNQQKTNETQKIKTQLTKIENERSLVLNQNSILKKEASGYFSLKQKHSQLIREYKILLQDKQIMQKKILKDRSSKDMNLVQMQNQFDQNLTEQRRRYEIINKKYQECQNKNLEWAAQVEKKINQIQRLKRGSETLMKQIKQLKEKFEKIFLQKTKKEKEYEVLKSERTIPDINQSNPKQILIEEKLSKAEEEIVRLYLKIDSEKKKNQQRDEENSYLQEQLSKIKIELQKKKQELEDQSEVIMQRIEQLQGKEKTYQQNIKDFNQQIESLKKKEKQSQQKLFVLQVENIRLQNQSEKQQKEMKKNIQKIHFTEETIKKKESQIQQLQNLKIEGTNKIQSSYEELNQLKIQYSILERDQEKKKMMIKVLEQNIKNLKTDIGIKDKAIKLKQKQNSETKAEMKSIKEVLLQNQIKYQNLQRQFNKLKEDIQQHLKKSFSDIPSGFADPSIKNLIEIGQKQERSTEGTMNKIINYTRDVKEAFHKILRKMKQIEFSLERLKYESQKIASDSNQESSQLKYKIEELEIQLLESVNEKQNIIEKNIEEIQQVKNKYLSKKKQCQNYSKQLDQTKIELKKSLQNKQIVKQENNQKQFQRISHIKDLDQMIVELNSQLKKLDSENCQKKGKIQKLEDKVQYLTEMLEQKEKLNQNSLEEKTKMSEILQEKNQKKKQLLKQMYELQMKLNSNQQIIESTKKLLDDEEKKAVELQTVVKILLDEKQTVIKNSLQSAEKINQLESFLLNKQNQNSMLQQECSLKKDQIEKLKQDFKNKMQTINELKFQLQKIQSQLSQNEEMLSCQKASAERKQKQKVNTFSHYQKQIDNLKQENHSLEKEYSTLKEKYSLQNVEQKKIIAKLSHQCDEEKQGREHLANKVNGLQVEVFQQKQKSVAKDEEIQILLKQIAEKDEKLLIAEENIENLNEVVNDKDQYMFQMSGKLFVLEKRLDQREKQKEEKIKNLEEEWSDKYESMCKESSREMESIKEEKEFLQRSLDEKEKQTIKLQEQMKGVLTSEEKNKKLFQEHMKKIEKQKLLLLTQKNLQIQKLTKQNKTSFDNIQAKSGEIRKLNQELEKAKSILSKMQSEKNQLEEKFNIQTMNHQSQFKQLKIKEKTFKSAKELLSRSQYNVEKQIRKLIQVWMSRLNMNLKVDHETSVYFAENIKFLEQKIIAAVHLRMQDEK